MKVYCVHEYHDNDGWFTSAELCSVHSTWDKAVDSIITYLREVLELKDGVLYIKHANPPREVLRGAQEHTWNSIRELIRESGSSEAITSYFRYYFIEEWCVDSDKEIDN